MARFLKGKNSNDKAKLKPKKEQEPIEETKEEDDLPLPADVLEELPPNIRSKIVHSLRLMMFSGTIPNPFAKKINETHIDKILDHVEKDSLRGYNNQRSIRRYDFAILVICIIVITGLAIFFSIIKESNLLINLIIGAFAFLGGLGYGKTKK